MVDDVLSRLRRVFFSPSASFGGWLASQATVLKRLHNKRVRITTKYGTIPNTSTERVFANGLRQLGRSYSAGISTGSPAGTAPLKQARKPSDIAVISGKGFV